PTRAPSSVERTLIADHLLRTVALPVRAGGVPAVPPHFAAEAASLRPGHGGRPNGSAGVTPRRRRRRQAIERARNASASAKASACAPALQPPKAIPAGGSSPDGSRRPRTGRSCVPCTGTE